MWLKIIIVLLFIGNIVALGRAFFTLIVDQGGDSKRTANMLLVRVSLAGLLLVAIGYGVWSGDPGPAHSLGPWRRWHGHGRGPHPGHAHRALRLD